MTNILSNSGIINGQPITVNEITQIIDVFTAAVPSDVTFRGEFFPTGSTTKIIASNGFIGSLSGTASVAISSSVSLTGPLTYNSASYAVTSSVLVPLKTNTSTYSIGYTTNVTTGLISGYGEIIAGNSSSVITGLTELIGKEMDTTGRSGSVFISMFQNNSSGNNFDSDKVIVPYALSSSNLTFQTLSGNSLSESTPFNYIITYV